MFERQTDHAKDMIARFQRAADEGQTRLPAGVPVPNAELSAWYSGIYDALIEQFGEDSEQFKQFQEINENANAFKMSRIRDRKDEPVESAYVGYLQILVAYLVSLQPPEPRGTAEPVGQKAPESLHQLLLHAVWRFPAVVRYLLLAVAIAFFLAFAVWSTLPDSTKESVLVDIQTLFR